MREAPHRGVRASRGRARPAPVRPARARPRRLRPPRLARAAPGSASSSALSWAWAIGLSLGGATWLGLLSRASRTLFVVRTVGSGCSWSDCQTGGQAPVRRRKQRPAERRELDRDTFAAAFEDRKARRRRDRTVRMTRLPSTLIVRFAVSESPRCIRLRPKQASVTTAVPFSAPRSSPRKETRLASPVLFSAGADRLGRHGPGVTAWGELPATAPVSGNSGGRGKPARLGQRSVRTHPSHRRWPPGLHRGSCDPRPRRSARRSARRSTEVATGRAVDERVRERGRVAPSARFAGQREPTRKIPRTVSRRRRAALVEGFRCRG